MVAGALVSVKVNELVVELLVCGNVFQTTGGVRLVAHSTWKRSLDDAVHRMVVLVDVTVAPIMDGAGRTNTVN